MPSFEDTSRPLLRTGSHIPFIDLQGVRPFDGTAIAGRFYRRVHFGYRVCGQCFLNACFFSFFSFFSSSHFCLDRPFGFSIHREINSFRMPLFLPELPLKVVNPSGCSFLPRPPFRVFSLASLFILCFSFCFFILAIDHRPY